MPAQVIGPTDHVVQFYDDDAQLTRAVGDHLAAGLHAGEVAVVIASPEHRASFEAHLTGLGFDLGAAAAQGTYVGLDSAEVLTGFLVDDVPDTARFEATVGQVIRTALERGPVRAYGEMVALLWADGLVPAAMELEALWNDLGRKLPFSLFCAYPADAMTSADHEQVASVCQLHSEVVGSGGPRQRAEVAHDHVRTRSFPCDPAAPRAARAFLSEVLLEWDEGALLGDAAVILGELAANAVVHARTGFTVTFTRTPGALQISVEDAARAVPWPRTPPSGAPSGRGMRLVHGLAAQWGTALGPEGKTVWAMLPRPPRDGEGDRCP